MNNYQENVEDGEIEETETISVSLAIPSPSFSSLNSQVPSEDLYSNFSSSAPGTIGAGNDSLATGGLVSSSVSSNPSGWFEDRRRDQSQNKNNMTGDSRNQNGNGQTLLLSSNQPFQNQRYSPSPQGIPPPSSSANRGRGVGVGGRIGNGRPVMQGGLSEKRPYLPRGQPYGPRPGYQPNQSWNSNPASPPPSHTPTSSNYSGMPEYYRGSNTNYYGPPSNPPRLPTSTKFSPLTSGPPVVPPISEWTGQTKAPIPPVVLGSNPPASNLTRTLSASAPQQLSGAQSTSQPSPPHQPQSIANQPQPQPVLPIFDSSQSKSKPQPLIQVVSDPNLTVDKARSAPFIAGNTANKIGLNSSQLPVRPPVLLTPVSASNSKVNITRLIDNVVSVAAPPSAAVASAVGLSSDELNLPSTVLANLPPPPPLEATQESSGSISSTAGKSRPRLSWGQGLLRRKSTGPIEATDSTQPATSSMGELKSEPQIDALPATIEVESGRLEQLIENNPVEKFREIEEDLKVAQENAPIKLESTQDPNVPIIETVTESANLVSAVDKKEDLTIRTPPNPENSQNLASPRTKGKPGRPANTEEIKSAKKDKKNNKKVQSQELKSVVTTGVARRKSFDENFVDSESDGEGKEEGRKRRAPSRGDSDKESVEDEAPKKRRGRPPAGTPKQGPVSPIAEPEEKEVLPPPQSVTKRVPRAIRGRGSGGGGGRGGKVDPDPPTVPPPVKRRSRSFGSFERDSLGGLFSSVSDLRNAYYALQGMVRIQVGMRGVGGFNKEDLLGLNQMLQNPQSVVNLPIPYTSEIVMCLDIIEAKSYQLGDAVVTLQLLQREIEDHSKKNLPNSSNSLDLSSIEGLVTGNPEVKEFDSKPTSLSSPMGLVKKSAIKSDFNVPKTPSSGKSPNLKLWPEPQAAKFLSENLKRVATAEICASGHFPPISPHVTSYDINSHFEQGKVELSKKRSVVMEEVRRRKLARTEAWETLADRYLAVKHRWEHYQQKHAPPQNEEETLGPRLRAMSSMRNILGPRAPSRLSTMRASTDLGRVDFDQDKITQQLAMKEMMARRLATGISNIPDMLSPWQHSDSSVPPKPPSWPPKDMYFPDIEPNEFFNCENQDFPKYVVDSPVIIDINGCRLTTDGRRPLCAIQPTGQPCPPNCNCSLQVDREERKYRPWSDMEKSIFLDKFLQYPKNFSKIAAFLTNRSTKDCIKFYYDSKTTIPYKSLLREFDNRKRHLRNSWTHSCAAAVSVGGLLYPPEGVDDKEHIAELPHDDVTYSTLCSHPMYMATALGFEGGDESEKGNYRRKQQSFLLNRLPRNSTEVKSLRRELKRDCFKAFTTNNGNSTIWAPPYYGDADNGGMPKKFTYPSDIRRIFQDGNHYGGYGQIDGGTMNNEGTQKTIPRRLKEGPSSSQKDHNFGILRENDRGRGRGGKRGRRPNTAGRGGAGKVSPNEVIDSKKTPTVIRGRGRGRGRWANRPGRGRGRGKANEDETEDQISAFADKDEIENEPDDEGDGFGGEVEGENPTDAAGLDDSIDEIDDSLEVQENDESDISQENEELDQEEELETVSEKQNLENNLKSNLDLPVPQDREIVAQDEEISDKGMEVVGDDVDLPSISIPLNTLLPIESEESVSPETQIENSSPSLNPLLDETTVITTELVEEIIESLDSSLISCVEQEREENEEDEVFEIEEIQLESESIVIDSSLYEDLSCQVEECLENIISQTIEIASEFPSHESNQNDLIEVLEEVPEEVTLQMESFESSSPLPMIPNHDDNLNVNEKKRKFSDVISEVLVMNGDGEENGEREGEDNDHDPERENNEEPPTTRKCIEMSVVEDTE